MEEDDTPCPFTLSRLRSFTERLESSFDARMSIANAMALAPGVLFAPLDKLDTLQPLSRTSKQAQDPLLPLPQPQPQPQQQLPPAGTKGSVPQQDSGNAAMPAAALAEISALKSEIAGIETLLGHLKKVMPSVHAKGGRGVHPKAQTEEQLRSRVHAHQLRINELQGLQGSKGVRAGTAAGAGAWSKTLRDGGRPASHKAESWSLERGGTPPLVTPVGRGEAVVLEAALEEALPEGALTAKYAAPALAAKAAAVRAGQEALQADRARGTAQLGAGSGRALTQGRPAAAATAAAATLAATPAAKAAIGGTPGEGTPTRHVMFPAPGDAAPSPQAHPLPHATAPAASGADTAGSAASPAGAAGNMAHIRGQGQQDSPGVGASGGSFTGAAAKQSAVQLFLSSQDITEDLELLSMTAKEAARQVAAHCAERARVMLKVDARYQEAFRALRVVVDAMHATHRALVGRLECAHGHAQEQAAVIEALGGGLEARARSLDAKDMQLAQLHSAHEALQWDSQQAITSLTSQNAILAGEVEHYSSRLEAEQAALHGLLEERMASATAQITSLTDERDDLHQRLRFLEKQNALLRHEHSRVPNISHTSVQTDPVEWAAEPADEDADAAQGAQIGGLDWLPTDAALGKLHSRGGLGTARKRRKPRHLGGFVHLLTLDKPGRVRGPMWTTNTIAQIYYDKTIHDLVCDRESSPRSPICNFTHDWHLTKFGLRHLADASVLDLIASVRHHQHTSARIAWFAHFTGLDETNDAMDSLQHLSFYLFVLQQLMWPSTLQAAFPETSGADGAAVAGSPSDVPVMLKGQQAIEAARAIFKYLNDPDAVSNFIARYIEPAPVTVAALLPPDAGPPGAGASGSEARMAGGGAATFLVPLDPLVKAFMNEFHKRIDKNVAHLRALFKAGDLDRDGSINYDEFAALLRLAAPDVTERLVSKAYTEAVRHQPPGCFLVPCTTFVNVARSFGFDRWKVDASAFASVLPGMGPVGGAALLAEGGVQALLSARRSSFKRPSSVGSQAPPSSPPHSNRSGSAEKQPTSPCALLRGIERFDTERGIKACLEGCLVGMRPSLDELLADARVRLRSPQHPTLQHLERQWYQFQSALAVVRGLPEPPDPAPPPPAAAPAASVSVSDHLHGSRPLSVFQPPSSSTPAAGAATTATIPSIQPTYPPANAAHAWLCFQLLCEGLAAVCSNRSIAGGGPRLTSSNSGSPRAGSPAAGQQRRMLVVPAMPWRTGPVSPLSPAAATTSGPPPPRASSGGGPLRSLGRSLSRNMLLSPLKAAGEGQMPAPPTQLPQAPGQPQYPDAGALSARQFHEPQQQQQQQQQQLEQQQQRQLDSAQVLRAEALQRQQQEQQQLQEMARVLRASAQQQQDQLQQTRAVPPQVMHLSLQRLKQQQQQQQPLVDSAEFAFPTC